MKIRVIGDAAFLPLTRKVSHAPRRYTLIDLEDFEAVSRSKWYATHYGRKPYVHATSLKHLAKHHEMLHSYVLRVKPGERVDHINGDPLDNRKQNLRIVTAAQNAQNAKRQTFSGKTSRFKGVCWDRHAGNWVANITAFGVRTFLGAFPDEVEAARAYDAAALVQHAEFARTNEMMRLFEMSDPFEPNCSYADVYDRTREIFVPHGDDLDPKSYDARLTMKLKREMRAVA